MAGAPATILNHEVLRIVEQNIKVPEDYGATVDPVLPFTKLSLLQKRKISP